MGISKYGNTRVKSHDGYSFDSKLEAALYDHLKWIQKDGEIKEITVKPNVYITRARIHMIPDFKAFNVKLGVEVYYEAKGYVTDVWRIKKKLWKFYGPGPMYIYTGTHSRLVGPEIIVPQIDLTDSDI